MKIVKINQDYAEEVHLNSYLILDFVYLDHLLKIKTFGGASGLETADGQVSC